MCVASGLPICTTGETGKYLFGEVLGEGKFGIVRLATHISTGTMVAIKSVRAPDFNSEEVRLQRLVNHPGVVKILDVIKDGARVHIVMEHCHKGSLFDLLASGVALTEEQAKQYFCQVLDAVDACHRAGVAHRDLKIENILIDGRGNLKLADFGLAAEILPGALLRGCCGSLNYAAPELWAKGAEYQGQCVDIWSCGVVLYALLTGRMAYDADDIPSLIRKVTAADYEVPPQVSREANGILARMFVVDPALRINMEEIRSHPFVGLGQGADWVVA